MEKQQQKDELNSELKEENIMLQRKLQGEYIQMTIVSMETNKLSLHLVPSQKKIVTV